MTSEPGRSALSFQLDMLKVEVETVNATIRQMDDISKNVKQWAIALWTAAVGGALGTPRLLAFVWATAAIPVAFWLVDAWFRVIQRRFVWRSLQIMDFLNDGALEESCREGRLVGLAVMDVGARRRRGAAYGSFVSWRRVLLFREFTLLYGALAAFSLALALAAVRMPGAMGAP